MASEFDKLESNETESSYGGSTYRLSYDHEENKKTRKKSFGGKAMIAFAVSVVLLFVFAYLALRHYDDAIKKLYAAETVNDGDESVAEFQSSVVINN